MVGGLKLAPSSRTPATEPEIRCSRMDGVARATDPLPRHPGIMAADMLYVYVGQEISSFIDAQASSFHRIMYLTLRTNLNITEISDNSPNSNPGSAALLIRSFLNSSKQLERSGSQSLDVLSRTIERADT